MGREQLPHLEPLAEKAWPGGRSKHLRFDLDGRRERHHVVARGQPFEVERAPRDTAHEQLEGGTMRVGWRRRTHMLE